MGTLFPWALPPAWACCFPVKIFMNKAGCIKFIPETSLSFSKRKQGGLGSHPRNPCILPTIPRKTQCAGRSPAPHSPDFCNIAFIKPYVRRCIPMSWSEHTMPRPPAHCSSLSSPWHLSLWAQHFFVYEKQKKKTPDEFRNELWNSIGFLPVIQLPGRKQMPIINHILVDQTWRQFIW